MALQSTVPDDRTTPDRTAATRTADTRQAAARNEPDHTATGAPPSPAQPPAFDFPSLRPSALPDRSSARGMPLPASRGPASAALIEVLTLAPHDARAGELLGLVASAVEKAIEEGADVLRHDDFQLTLFCLFELHYGGISGVSDDWEWNLPLIAVRAQIVRALERELVSRVDMPDPGIAKRSVSTALFELTSGEDGVGFADYIANQATDAQLHEFMVQRSIYALIQADPHSWGIPRLQGAAKAALVEIQSDEYGGGRPQWMRSSVFGRAMNHLGLDAGHGHYVDHVSALTLASVNMVSMFGLQRRLRGCTVGHLAAFELTAAAPSREFGDGFRRNGYGTEVTQYFDDHIEPDSIHVRIAGRDLAENLVRAEPEVLDDVLFGAAACLAMSRWEAEEIMAAWASGESALRMPY